MSFHLSNLTNNPYVQQVNQSVVSNITSAATGAVNNLIKNVDGALGAAGGIASGLAGSLASAGVPIGAVGDIMSSQLDQLISGGSSFFTTNNPNRMMGNALANRNFAATNGSNPEIQIPSQQHQTTGGVNYVYPPDPAPYFMKFEFFKYTRPSPFTETTSQSLGSIILPMPLNGLVDATSATWQSRELNAAGNVLDALKDSDVGIKKAQEGGLAGVADQGLNTIEDAAMAQSNRLGAAISQELVDARNSQLGLVDNPSLSQLFQGVGFRQFSFNWTFAPKTDQESLLLRDMIRFIKAKHLPTFTGSGGTNGTSYLFNYPAIVKPSFGGTAGSTAEQFMTSFKFCVLKNVVANFAPQGVPAFYSSTKAPVFITLQMDFEEMEYVLATDYDPNAKGITTNAIIIGQAKNAVKNLLGLPTDKSVG